jgi:hypothetical protein
MTESEADFSQSRGQGLLNINLECNPLIGDKGAGAIGELISNQNAFSNNLKMVNLNECGITDKGYELLTQALLQRATLASSQNITHVKITIERNNIGQMN